MTEFAIRNSASAILRRLQTLAVESGSSSRAARLSPRYREIFANRLASNGSMTLRDSDIESALARAEQNWPHEFIDQSSAHRAHAAEQNDFYVTVPDKSAALALLSAEERLNFANTGRFPAHIRIVPKDKP